MLAGFLEKAGDSPVLVSACLLGLGTRYDGGAKKDEILVEFARSHCVIPVCPEQLGGLSTPRPKSGLSGGDGRAVISGRASVKSDSGRDVTENFLRGARLAAAIAAMTGARFAVLKEKSPSCGVSQTSIDFQTAEGSGVAAEVLKARGLELFGVP